MPIDFRRGLHDLGNGIYAWLQPDGSWGWSNAGLVVDSGESLLVDTLFDLKLTAAMLEAMRRAEPAAERIGTLINTHANGDHCYGNQLVKGARVVTSEATASEFGEVTPAMLHAMVNQPEAAGPAAAFLREAFGAFDFEGIEVPPPDETFRGEWRCRVGEKEIRAIEVGPAHTRGDVLVHVPADRVVFTGDILFIGGTPIVWEGPVDNWIAACDRILAMDLDHIVPGHGPLTDAAGVRAVRDYLGFIRDETRLRFEAGLSPRDAAFDIPLGAYADWLDSERIVVNVATLYREFGCAEPTPNVVELFAAMADYTRAR
ncbi:MAG: MBL fold metallo-hydrolase [Myxococcota bacterium]